MDDVVRKAEAWLADDPDEKDRAELAALLTQAKTGDPEALACLAERFTGELRFGTAGLRGPVYAGQTGMNTATVTRATAGLVSVLRQQAGNDFRVIIGFDGRHRSADFAGTVAGVITAAGGRAELLPRMLPTPVLVHATRALAADAGVMITASHNPAADNGYKVYLGGRMTTPTEAGMAIIPPLDSLIAEAIAASGPANQIPVADSGLLTLPEDVVENYLDAAGELVAGWRTRAAAAHRLGDGSGQLAWGAAPQRLRVVLTPMHGVGAETCLAALEASGLAEVVLVAEQAKPNPDFPTVAFPNPEEPGALDLAIKLARRVDADLVVALDPDADRCAVAIPQAGRWRALSGDELGAILAEFVCSLHDGGVVSRSLPTSSHLDLIAEEYGLTSVETLGGFKWIARVPGLVYGYEEAIGYCLNPQAVPDKDGITAALAVTLVAGLLRTQGLGLEAVLAEQALRHGLVRTSPLTYRLDEKAQIKAGLAHFAARLPGRLAGAEVTSCDDLSLGYHGLAPTPGWRLETARGDRVILRPSGTEAKLKCYLQVHEPVGQADLVAAQSRADARIQQLKDQVHTLLFG